MFNKFIGEAKGIFNIITLVELLVCLICFLSGLMFYTNANMSNTVVSIFTGLILIMNGAASIFFYIKRGGIVLYNNNFFYGIALILFGLLAMIFGNVLAIMIGIYFLILGVQKINYGIFLKKFGESSWLLTVAIGVLLMVMAIVTMVTNGEKAIPVAGICLIGYGLINGISVILLRKRSKYFIAD